MSEQFQGFGDYQDAQDYVQRCTEWCKEKRLFEEAESSLQVKAAVRIVIGFVVFIILLLKV